MADDETICSICQSADKLSNDKLLINTACGHKFCRNCIDRELAKKSQFMCPRCRKGPKHAGQSKDTVVKRTGLSEKTLDEIITQKEISHRKRVVKM